MVFPSGAAQSVTLATSSCNPSQYSNTPTCVQEVTGTAPGPFTATWSLSSGNLVPPGATIYLTFTMESEAAVTTSGVADVYALALSATDTTGANTVLSPVTIYEAPTPTLGWSAVPTTTPTAGTTFTMSVTCSSSCSTGLPLAVSKSSFTPATGSTSSPKLTLSPSTFTSAGTIAQAISVNETGAGALVLQVTGNGALSSSYSSGGGTLTAVLSSSITVNPAALAKVTVTASSVGAGKIVNETVLAPIAGTAFVGSLTDAFGNTLITATGSITFTATTTFGEFAGWSSSAAYNGTAYPWYNVAGVEAQASCTVALGTCSLSSSLGYLFGVTDLSTSVITATSGSLSGTGPTIKTWPFGFTTSSVPPVAPTFSGSGTVAAGSAVKVYANPVSGCTAAKECQAGVPVTLFTSNNKLVGSATTLSNGTAAVVYTPSTVAGSSRTFMYELAVNGGTTKNSTVSGSLVTIAGTLAGLSIQTYAGSVSTGNGYSTTVPSGKLYIVVSGADAYGNLALIPNSNPNSPYTAITLSASSGTLSATTVYVYGGTSGAGPETGTNGTLSSPSNGGINAITIKAGSSTGTITLTASEASLTGTGTVTVVSAAPNLVITSAPTSVQTGIPSVITGIVNASTGISGNKIAAGGVTYNVVGTSGIATATLTCTTSGAGCSFSISVLLSATGENAVNVTVSDSQSPANVAFTIVQVPPVSASASFAFPSSSAPKVETLGSSGVFGLNVTVTNNQGQVKTLSGIVIITLASSGQVVGGGSFNNLAFGATLTNVFCPITANLVPGTYSLNVFVLSSSGAPLSSPLAVSAALP